MADCSNLLQLVAHIHILATSCVICRHTLLILATFLCSTFARKAWLNYFPTLFPHPLHLLFSECGMRNTIPTWAVKSDLGCRFETCDVSSSSFCLVSRLAPLFLRNLIYHFSLSSRDYWSKAVGLETGFYSLFMCPCKVSGFLKNICRDKILLLGTWFLLEIK